MPPAKRRGVNRPKGNAELQLGDLVLAKVKGFPPWPAKICRPEDWDKSPDPRKYFVEFFGTAEIAFVAPADIQIFTNDSKSKLAARCQGKTVKYFAQAVKEICEAFEKLQKSLDESREGAYETEVGTISALSIDVEGRNLDNSEMDRLEVQKQVLQKSVNNKPFGSIDELHLEPCTRSRGTMSNDLCGLNDTACESESPILSFKRSKPSANNKKRAKEAKVMMTEVIADFDIPKEGASHHLVGSHKNVAETYLPNSVVEASRKHYTDDKVLEIPSSHLVAKDSQAKEEGKIQKSADDDKLHMGHGEIRKLPNGSRLTSTYADSSLEDENLEIHAGIVKEHSTLKKSKKKLPKTDIQNNGPLNVKPVTSEAKAVGRVSIKPGKKDLVGSSKHKLATMEELPPAKRSKSGQKGVLVGKSSTKGNIRFTSNNKNKKSFKIEILENMKADDNLTSMAEARGNKNHQHSEKSSKGADDPLCVTVIAEDSSQKTHKRFDDTSTTSVSDGVLTKKNNNGSKKGSSKHGTPRCGASSPQKESTTIC
ncbi:hypothetical protein HPP92_025762 [Vanilla planifolia]|uniref:PWWP domain-containing protein n=1 Tax=Vanilla planifolia TaxID=51239 RepID=A0A835PND8_VANPL|nr:hypothetical protein HPP92_025762 [Vanilla planifolia]